MERYLESNPLSTRDKNRLEKSLEVLASLGISDPSEHDLKVVLRHALLECPDIGHGDSTIAGYISTARKYFRWERKQEGDDMQMELPFTEAKDELSTVEPQVPIETASSETTETTEPLDPAESAESIESTASDQQAESPERDPEPPVMSEAPKKKPGRKPNPDKSNRIQFSVYLKTETYEGLREIAQYSGQNVSDILSGLADDCVARNQEQIARVKEFMRALKFSGVKTNA